MTSHLPVLMTSDLFKDTAPQDILTVLNHTNSYIRTFEKDDLIYKLNEKVHHVAIVIEGTVNIATEDHAGNQRIINTVSEGKMFAKAHACLHLRPVMLRSICQTDVTVLFIDIDRLFGDCGLPYGLQNHVIKNYVDMLAEAALIQYNYIRHTAHRTIRAKLLSYLEDQQAMAGTDYFDVPLNRQQLADYLGIDRSALSTELSKMRSEGLIEYDRNRFIFKNK